MAPLSRRATAVRSQADSWQEIWETGPYAQRISEVLEKAKHSVVFTGWQMDSRLLLPIPPAIPEGTPNPSEVETLREKALRLCEASPSLHFYFLIWDHAAFYFFQREPWQGRIWKNLHPRIHFVFDNRHLFGCSHHEKICLVDENIAFCGGIDLCDERWDTREHRFEEPRRSLNWKAECFGPYHDLSVEVTGPICRDIHDHLKTRWERLSTIPFPRWSRKISANSTVRGLPLTVTMSRTRAEVDPDPHQPTLIRETEFLFRDLIQSAEKRILIEGQYFWSQQITSWLCARMLTQPLKITLILTTPRLLKFLSSQMAAYEFDLLRKLEETATWTGSHLQILTPVALPPFGGARPKPVYIHSKVLIVDDTYLSIGSANLAARALRVDTELQLTLEGRSGKNGEKARSHIRQVATEIEAHWHRHGLCLRPIYPARELRHLRGPRLPWQRLFDPTHPLFLFLKIRVIHFLRQTKRAPSTRWLKLPFFWAALGGSVILAGIESKWGLEWWPTLCASALAGAALLAYACGRIFPNHFERALDLRASSEGRRLRDRLGLRRFGAVVRMTLDPTLPLWLKLSGSGIYFVVFPWFVATNLVILPTSVYFLCRGMMKLTTFLTKSLMSPW